MIGSQGYSGKSEHQDDQSGMLIDSHSNWQSHGQTRHQNDAMILVTVSEVSIKINYHQQGSQ